MADPVKLTVFAIGDPDIDEPVFTYGAKIPPNSNGKIKNAHGTLWFAKDAGQQDIEFHLRDQTGEQLRFKGGGDPADAIWISTGGCPQTPGIPAGAFQIVDVQNKKLTIRNLGAAGEYHYRLRFEGNAGGRSFDPIMRNDGPPPLG